MGFRDFIIFMLFFLAGAAVLAAIVYLIIRLIGKAQSGNEMSAYMRFNKELDQRLEKRGFKRTLVISDSLAVDEEQGTFYCSFPYGRTMEETILPLSAITEYRIEPAAAFTTGYLFTYAFVDNYPPRKVSRQAHVIGDDVKDRLAAALDKYGAGKQVEPEEKNE